jgi:hypothetical protein
MHREAMRGVELGELTDARRSSGASGKVPRMA